MRATPFALAFGEIAPRFPAIAEALQLQGTAATDRDRFVLLEPVGRLLREIVQPDAGADALEAHVLLLHHAYLFWAAEQRVYPISEPALRRAVAEKRMTTDLPHAAQYLQLPELRVWGAPHDGNPPEPLDGMFVSEATPGGPGAIAVLAIFGMRPDRPGFSAVCWRGEQTRTIPPPARSKSRPHATMAAPRLGPRWRVGRQPDCIQSPLPANCSCSPAGS